MLHFFCGLDLVFIAFVQLEIPAELEQESAMNYEVYHGSPHRWIQGSPLDLKAGSLQR